MSPPCLPIAAAVVPARPWPVPGRALARWTQVAPPTDRSRLAPVRPPFVGPVGRLPPVPSSTILIEDVLTGRVRSTELSQVFVDALFSDDSAQALRPRDPTMLLAFAEAAQHGMRAGAPSTTEAKNRTG